MEWVTVENDPREWPDVEETGDTYLENALLKARAVAAALALPALADDSGIEVDALGGAPGPRSARYAGEGATDERNLRQLIRALKGIPAGGRTARYRCVAALAMPDGTEVHAEATCEGALDRHASGSGGLRLRPDLRAGRMGRDHGRAQRRAEGPDQPPRPGAPGARRARWAERAPPRV